MPKIKNAEKNVNFHTPVLIGVVAIHSLFRQMYENILCNSQSQFISRNMEERQS